nr:NAD(P)(+) transhydrogenase (Re/Si-specific) subunit beta [Leifsonia xyli]
MTVLAWVTGLVYLAAATCFVIRLHLMRTPATARRGNLISACGMAAAVAVTLIAVLIEGSADGIGWIALGIGLAAGGVFGAVRARTVKMTDIPQLISVFNAVGGAAAAVAFADFLHRTSGAVVPLVASIPIVLDVLIGAVTLSGSLIAAGKLQGIIPGRPVQFPGARAVSALVVIVALAAGVLTVVLPRNPWLLLALLVAALAFGVLMVLPIGGADAPVVCRCSTRSPASRWRWPGS